MEKIVRIISQSPLASRQYKDGNGNERVVNSVSFRLTDGVDEFVAEITGERAVNFPKLDYMHNYAVQCTMAVREWTSQQGEIQQSNKIYINRICAI